jgi:hypothetical protein
MWRLGFLKIIASVILDQLIGIFKHFQTGHCVSSIRGFAAAFFYVNVPDNA